MLFDSTIYIVFLAVVGLVYWQLTHRQQNFFLLAASYFFYGWWDYRFLGLMAISTVADYAIGNQIHRSGSPLVRRRLLYASVSLNLCFLGFFKYFGFFIDSAVAASDVLGFGHIPRVVWQIALPPAISFYTFQEIAYIVDVYHGRLQPARSLSGYALFVSLFPHLIAGPIQQPSHLLPQVETRRRWSSDSAFDGIMLIVEGLFRKVVIADNCALLADAVFRGHFGPPSALAVLIGTYAFAGQIYGDFSGYSSIARGSAQLLGFHFMVNFRQPYLSESLQEFWRRWHISLSTWLRDYLDVPLGGNRRGEGRTYLNLLATMLLGGLWHGANWTYVLWGLIHGAGLAVERRLRPTGAGPTKDSLVGRWVRRIVVFNLVCLAWVFFRAATTREAFLLLSGLGTWRWEPIYGTALLFLGFFAAMQLLLDLHLERTGAEYVGGQASYRLRVVVAVLLCSLITLFAANQSNAFIYFRF